MTSCIVVGMVSLVGAGLTLYSGFGLGTLHTGIFFMAMGINPIGLSQWPLILVATLAAFSGVLIGKRFLHKRSR